MEIKNSQYQKCRTKGNKNSFNVYLLKTFKQTSNSIKHNTCDFSALSCL